MLSGALAAGALAACRVPAPPASLTPSTPGVVAVAHVGFAGPENVVYDSVADVFLVSNVNGDAATRDGNGFVSRVAPDGRVLELKWIAGGARGAVLDAPKGLALHGDTLAVADLGGVREFDRRTGAPLRTVSIPGWVMNDLLFAPDGSLWVTDTGPERTTPPDTSRDVDAVWRVAADGRAAAVARGLALGRPDGITSDGGGDGGVLVATFGANRLERVGGAVSTRWDTARTLPAGRDDGLRRLRDGSLVVTSWDARAVWRVTPAGTTPLLTDVTSPAGVAVDTRRHRLAVTSMQGDALYLLPLR